MSATQQEKLKNESARMNLLADQLVERVDRREQFSRAADRCLLLADPMVERFAEWRKKFPFAPGASLTNSDLFTVTLETYGQAKKQFRLKGPIVCLDFPLAREKLHFLTFMYGNKKRKVGDLYRGVHPIGVAILVNEFGRKLEDKWDIQARTLKALLHDAIEDILAKPKDVPSGVIVKEIRATALDFCVRGWDGPPQHVQRLRDGILHLTDTFDVSLGRRHLEQVVRALSKYDADEIEIRWADKYHNTMTDAVFVQQKAVKDPVEIIKREKIATSKVPVARAIWAAASFRVKDAFSISAKESLQMILEPTRSLQNAAREAEDKIAKAGGLSALAQVQNQASRQFNEVMRTLSLL